jgi:hypothetical protein
MANPRALADSDSSACCNALDNNGKRWVVIFVIMILNQHRLRDQDVAFQVDIVLGGYDGIRANCAVVINYNQGVTLTI